MSAVNAVPKRFTVQRNNNFDFIRILAALSVLVSHQFALSGLPEPRLFGVESLGGLGVMTFFSISGYWVVQSWQSDPHLLRFAARRLLRIWPGLALVLLLCAVVVGPWVSTLSLREYFSHPALWAYTRNLMFDMVDHLPLQFVGNAMPQAVNGSLWTLPLEIQWYALLALLGVAGLWRFKRLWMLLSAVAALITYLVLAPLYLAQASLFPVGINQVYALHFGTYFLAGATLGLLPFRAQMRHANTALVTAWALGTTALALDQALLALWCVVPVTAIWVGTARIPFVHQVGRWGDLSFGLYIYAFPVQQVMIWQFKDRLSWGGLLAVCMAITLACAWLSWHGLEKWALTLKPIRPIP